MDLKINIIEAAAEIAEQMLEREYIILYPEKSGVHLHKMIWTVTELEFDIITHYTEDAQNRFNNIYDEVFDLLISAKTIEDVKD
jgi:hypothetical protein